MRAHIFLLLPVFATCSWAQSDFRLSTTEIPRLEDAITETNLPPPLGDLAIRQKLDASATMSPKADEVLKQVVNALKTRQFENALPKLEYLQTLRPTEPDLLILRGCIYAESGRAEAAEGLFRKAILVAPAHPWARLNLAEAQLSQKKYNEAETTLAVLSATRPESEVVRFKLVLAMALQKKFAPAESEVKYLMDNSNTPAGYYARAAIAFASGNNQLGKELVQDAAKKYGEAQTSYFYNSLVTQDWVPKRE